MKRRRRAIRNTSGQHPGTDLRVTRFLYDNELARLKERNKELRSQGIRNQSTLKTTPLILASLHDRRPQTNNNPESRSPTSRDHIHKKTLHHCLEASSLHTQLHSTMVELIAEQPKAAPKTAKHSIVAEYESPVKSTLLDDSVAQMALFGTLAAMAVLVYKAGTA